jgi:hypothetical protein
VGNDSRLRQFNGIDHFERIGVDRQQHRVAPLLILIGTNVECKSALLGAASRRYPARMEDFELPASLFLK